VLNFIKALKRHVQLLDMSFFYSIFTNKKYMKKVIFILLTVFISINTFSQTFKGGFLIGVSGSQVDGDTQKGYKKPGMYGGFFVQRVFTEKISGKIELYYIGKGAVNKVDNADGTSYEQFKTVLHYVEMPLLLNFAAHPKFQIAAGIAPAYLMKAKLFVNQSLIPEKGYNISNFDLSPTLHVDFYLLKRLSISVRFSYSAMSIRTQDNENWFNNNLNLGLNYNFK